MTEGPFGIPLPPEFVASVQAQHEQHVMAIESERLAIDRMLTGMNNEDLATLRGIFQDTATDTSGRLSAYYEGICSSILTYAREVCSGCGGKKHDSVEALLEAHGQKQTDEKTEQDELAASHEDGTVSAFAGVDEARSPAFVDESRELIGQTGMLTGSLIQKMSEYNLDDLRDEDTNQILGFICLNCKVKYPSIADRMLKAPDECSGCQQKAKWG